LDVKGAAVSKRANDDVVIEKLDMTVGVGDRSFDRLPYFRGHVLGAVQSA
jgi:hypothetical protein